MRTSPVIDDFCILVDNVIQIRIKGDSDENLNIDSASVEIFDINGISVFSSSCIYSYGIISFTVPANTIDLGLYYRALFSVTFDDTTITKFNHFLHFVNYVYPCPIIEADLFKHIPFLKNRAPKESSDGTWNDQIDAAFEEVKSRIRNQSTSAMGFGMVDYNQISLAVLYKALANCCQLLAIASNSNDSYWWTEYNIKITEYQLQMKDSKIAYDANQDGKISDDPGNYRTMRTGRLVF